MNLTSRTPTPAQAEQITVIKGAAEAFARMVETTLPSRERSLALTKIEEAAMWAVKAVF